MGPWSAACGILAAVAALECPSTGIATAAPDRAWARGMTACSPDHGPFADGSSGLHAQGDPRQNASSLMSRSLKLSQGAWMLGDADHTDIHPVQGDQHEPHLRRQANRRAEGAPRARMLPGTVFVGHHGPPLVFRLLRRDDLRSAWRMPARCSRSGAGRCRRGRCSRSRRSSRGIRPGARGRRRGPARGRTSHCCPGRKRMAPAA